jgi:hypothetical protein
MKNENSIKEEGKLSIQVTMISFLFGTLIFILYQISKNQTIFFVGFLYVLTAVFFNTIILLKLVYLLITTKNHRLYILSRIGIICLNIPITLTYISIIFNQEFIKP